MKEKVELKPIPLRKEKRLSHSHLIRQKQLTNKGNQPVEFDWLCHSALLKKGSCFLLKWALALLPLLLEKKIIIVKGQSNFWLRQRLVSLEF